MAVNEKIGTALVSHFNSIGMSQKDIATKLDVSQQYVSSILKGTLLGRNGAKRWEEAFGIQQSWLLSGEGAMLVTQAEEQHSPTTQLGTEIYSGKIIPYYDAEVAAGTTYGMEMAQARPAGMIEIGGLMKDSEFALRVYGNSMVPNYPAGCVVGLRQHMDSFIEPGTVYVVETSENRYLKRLYYNKERSAFRCISDNTMKYEEGPMKGEFVYQEFDIPFTEAHRLLRVTGVVKRNIL